MGVEDFYPVMPLGICYYAGKILAACYPELEYRKGYRTTSEQGREPTTIAHGWNVNGVGVVIDSTMPPLLRPAIRAGQLQVVYREANVDGCGSFGVSCGMSWLGVSEASVPYGREVRKRDRRKGSLGGRVRAGRAGG
jgi:hypothetical protein